MAQIFYSEKFFCDGYGVDTREKARDIADSLLHRDIDGIQLVSPEPASLEQYKLAHSPRYAQAIMTGRPFSWAIKNGIGEWSQDLATSAAWSTGGVISAVRAALATRGNTGSLTSGLHHARSTHGAGFCTINGLVIGARVALISGARRVLIVDFDAHCGGGTASLLRANEGIEQIDVSVSSYDKYPSTAQTQLWMANGENYLTTISSALSAVVDPASIDLVIYNAGMDPHERCSTGGERGITTETLAKREEMLFSWTASHQIPVAFVLAGGYSGRSLSREELVDLHRLTLTASATHPFVTL